MELNAAITAKYNDWVEQLRKFIPGDEAIDVLHTVLLSVMERGLEEGREIRNLDKYIIGSCRMAYFSKNSPYNRERGWREYPSDTIEPEQADTTDKEENEGKKDVWRLIDEAPFSWWEKEVFKRKILENKTFAELANETKLNIGQVWYSFAKVRKHLKNKYDGQTEKKQN